GSINIIQAPAAIPASLARLPGNQIFDAARERFALAQSFAELREHRDATRRDILGWWIDQCPMIGERNIVEIIINIVDIECRPAAISALQAFDPFGTALDRRIEARAGAGAARSVHRHHDYGGVIEVRIMRIGILESPAAGPYIGALHRPVAGGIK